MNKHKRKIVYGPNISTNSHFPPTIPPPDPDRHSYVFEKAYRFPFSQYILSFEKSGEALVRTGSRLLDEKWLLHPHPNFLPLRPISIQHRHRPLSPLEQSL